MEETLKSIQVKKASGESELYSEKKIIRSLKNAGASPKHAKKVCQILRSLIYPGITTQKLYRMAFDLLKKEAHNIAARYSLKQAILNLGPSGYPFENFVGALLKSQGYHTRVSVVLRGACVKHEVDVVATQKNRRILVECKYHNNQGRKNDIKTALYVYARSLDLKNSHHDRDNYEFWLVTNTKFTEEAKKYAECVGLKLIGWDYPPGESLKDLIKKEELHPITCLTTLKKRHKEELLKQNIVLCRELIKNPQLLVDLGLKDSPIRKVQKELVEITGV